ncbi:hypothetical protein JAAARDRAFT_330681 [Jaapia argillacea MUCL 33604]|uniref:Uncharacterized protein n=1 Tax=Jaapia argillacea MUCL 33604 TaxID=933084 RepID=A0A067PZQ5_9AGAM|nr:hypothetical protein JAAARDRAFT_330681 [Jaapia argillacea MUCL 33604]
MPSAELLLSCVHSTRQIDCTPGVKVELLWRKLPVSLLDSSLHFAPVACSTRSGHSTRPGPWRQSRTTLKVDAVSGEWIAARETQQHVTDGYRNENKAVLVASTSLPQP